jgi:hypothetical protein
MEKGGSLKAAGFGDGHECQTPVKHIPKFILHILEKPLRYLYAKLQMSPPGTSQILRKKHGYQKMQKMRTGVSNVD